MTQARAVVKLNIYDLMDNSYLHSVGLGAYHTGVEVYGVEYAFGGNEVPGATGIFEQTPCVPPQNCRFRESLLIADTTMSRTEVRSLVVQMQKEYLATSYHVLNRNCNAFSNDFCMRLTKTGTPTWVNRLSSLGSMVNSVIPIAPSIASPAAPTPANAGVFQGPGHSLTGGSTTSASATSTTTPTASAGATEAEKRAARLAAIERRLGAPST